MLNNMKLGTKLIGAFLIVAALCAFVGVFGAMKLRSTNSAYSAAMKDNIDNLNSVADLRSTFLERRLSVYRLVTMDTPETREGLLRDVETSRLHFKESLDRYEKAIDTDEARFVESDRQLFGEVSSIDRDYNQVVESVIAAVRQNRHEQAIAALVGAASKGTSMQEALDRLSTLNIKMGQQLSSDLTASAGSAVVTDVVVVLVTVLISLAMGIGLSLLITRPMQQMTITAERIAEGDVSQTIDHSSRDELGQLADAFRNIVTMVKGRATAAEKIAAGDLNVSVSAASDRDVLGKALAQVLANLKRLMDEMGKMAREHDLGDIDVMIPASEFQGAYSKVADGINAMVAGHITVKKKAMACIAEFGKGNFEAPLEKFPGKKAFINDTIEQLRSNLRTLIAEMNRMSAEHDRGDIDVSIPAEKFEGDYRKMAQGINGMVAGHITVKKKAMACIAEFGKGNFEAPLEKFPGKKAFINDTIEQLRSNLRTLIAEMNRMSAEHDRGDIDVSIPAEKFEGDYRKMAQGINGMVAGHITVKKKAMACIAEFAQGNFEAPLEKFPGKKAFINDNIERLRTNLKALITDADILVKAALVGSLSTRADANQAQRRLSEDCGRRQPHSRRCHRTAK